MNKKNDIVGKRFGRLTVHNEYIKRGKSQEKHWLCICDCGERTYKRKCDLKSGKYISCPKCSKDRSIKKMKKENEYEICKDYVKGYIKTKDKEITFIFDIEDFDKVKRLKWMSHNNGYITGHIKNNKYTLLHRFIMDVEEDCLIDHINHDKTDNRRCNLRKSNYVNNARNKTINNKNGHTGIKYNKKYNNYTANINVNYKSIHLGTYNTIEDAIQSRIDAENKYFEEHSYTNSLLISERIKIDNSEEVESVEV